MEVAAPTWIMLGIVMLVVLAVVGLITAGIIALVVSRNRRDQ
jgi:hypothetical protein